MPKIVSNDGLTLWDKVVANLTATIDVASLTAGTGQTSAPITVTGAAFGDVVLVSAPHDMQGIRVFGWVNAANQVTLRFENGTTGAVDLPNGNYKIKVLRG
jgi:hypothetical protein